MERHGEIIYGELLSKLHGLRNRRKWNQLNSRVAHTLGILLLWTAAALIAEAIFRFPSLVRVFIAWSWVVLLVAGWFWAFVIPLYSIVFLRRMPEDDILAILVGEWQEALKDRLADALQVYRNREDHPGSSSHLAVLSLSRIYEEIKDLDFRRASSISTMTRSWKFVGGCVCACVFMVLMWKGSMLGASQRLWNPHKIFLQPAPFQLHIRPGNIRVVQGEEVTLSVEVQGSAPLFVSLRIKEEGGAWTEKRLEQPFIHHIPAIRSGFIYFVQAERVVSPEFTVQVIHRPVVRVLQIKLQPPSYLDSGTRVMEPNTGDVEALKGTRVNVSILSSKPLTKGSILFQQDEEVRMRVQDSMGRGSFIVEQDDRFWVSLTDTAGLSNSDPIAYSIRVQPDFHPIARILSPARNTDLDESMEVPLVLEAEDDYGLSAGRIVFQVHPGGSIDASAESLHTDNLFTDPDEPSRVLLDTTWDLDPLNLIPEDVVTYAFEVWDNDGVSGPKRALSRTYTVRFPSMFEIFEEIEKAQDDQAASLSDLIEDGEILKEELRRIDEELKGGKELEWEERKALEQAVTEQDELHDRVEALKKDMDDIVDRLERYDLPSMETLEKYEELQNLYREIASPELMEAMRKLREAISQVDQDKLKAAAEAFKLNQENFMQAIERTLALLKRLQIEQKTDEIVKRIEDLVGRQEGVNEALETPNPDEKDALAAEERRISQDTKSLQGEMNALADRMAEIPRMPQDKLEEARYEMEEGRLIENLDVTANRIDTGRFENARASASDAKETMSQVAERLNELREGLQNSQMKMVQKALQRASHRLLQLSSGQEELISGRQEGKAGVSDAMEHQYRLLSGLSQVADSLAELSEQTFFVTPEMGRAVGETHAHMRNALSVLEQAGGRGALKSQGLALGGLNKTVLIIHDALDKMSEGGSGLGSGEFFRQMEKMTMEQMGINQQTLDRMQRGRLTLQEQAAMERLAAEQEAVQKALEELAGEYGDRAEIAGRMDGLIREMENVVQDLKKDQVNPQTIRRQESILSRLLDAQRSMQKRDISRRREAITGKDFIRQSPEVLPSDFDALRERLQRDILRLSKEGYTEEYQILIRKYLEALSGNTNR